MNPFLKHPVIHSYFWKSIPAVHHKTFITMPLIETEMMSIVVVIHKLIIYKLLRYKRWMINNWRNYQVIMNCHPRAVVTIDNIDYYSGEKTCNKADRICSKISIDYFSFKRYRVSILIFDHSVLKVLNKQVERLMNTVQNKNPVNIFRVSLRSFERSSRYVYQKYD